CTRKKASWHGACTSTPDGSGRTRFSILSRYIGTMNTPQVATPSRAPSAHAIDDTVTPFEVARLDLRGRVVRLGPVVDDILSRHEYPASVAKLLGEAIVLTVMLGSALKIEGRLILQTSTDGPVRMLVVDFVMPDKVRAYAR